MTNQDAAPSPRRSVRRYLRRLRDRGHCREFARTLRGRRRASALRAMVDGPVVVTRLERKGLQAFGRVLTASLPGDVDQAREISQAVDAGLAVLPVPFTCLRRSLVLLRELQRCGLGGDLSIGVKRGAFGVAAHAWVQVDEEIVNDDPANIQVYTRLPWADVDLRRLGLG